MNLHWGFSGSRIVAVIGAVIAGSLLTVFLALPAGAEESAKESAKASGDQHGSAAEVGRALSNPLSNVWALFTEFDLIFSSGNFSADDDKIGGQMNFQPILPVPLYGTEETGQWKMIVRPAIPFVFSQARPQPNVPPVPDSYNYDTGLADILLPLPIAPPLENKNLIFGMGPTFTFPAATNDNLGRRQWQAGVASVVGYKTKQYVLGVFPQYFWGVGGRGDKNGEVKNASNMNLLYFAYINLADAWQIGFNPAVTYNDKAAHGNKWNVPVGMGLTHTMKLGNRPVKFQFSVEYSVVSQDDFGKRAMIKLNIIPVIMGLVQNPIFGGD
jgi:hypothetical protein